MILNNAQLNFLQWRWFSDNPGKNYVDSKLYKLLQSYFLLTRAAPPPPAPPFNVVSIKMSFDNNYTQLSSWSTLDRGEWGETQWFSVNLEEDAFKF